MRDVFEPLRDIPEPPLRPGLEALASARRRTRRRNALRVAAGGVAALALLVGSSVVVDRFRSPAAQPPAASADTHAPKAAPRAPAPEAVDRHATRIAQALIAAVPAGYQAASVKRNGEPSDKYRIRLSIGKGGYRAVTLVQVTAAARAGVVAALFGTDLPAPRAGADPCAAHTDLGIEGATVTGCRTLDIGGTAVRVVSATDPGTGQVLSATRYLDGGYLVVSASQGIRAYRVSPAGDEWIWEVAVNPRHEQPLAELPFTADRLAALAVDPALLP